jgi:hypothetical protein
MGRYFFCCFTGKKRKKNKKKNDPRHNHSNRLTNSLREGQGSDNSLQSSISTAFVPSLLPSQPMYPPPSSQPSGTVIFEDSNENRIPAGKEEQRQEPCPGCNQVAVLEYDSEFGTGCDSCMWERRREAQQRRWADRQRQRDEENARAEKERKERKERTEELRRLEQAQRASWEAENQWNKRKGSIEAQNIIPFDQGRLGGKEDVVGEGVCFGYIHRWYLEIGDPEGFVRNAEAHLQEAKASQVVRDEVNEQFAKKSGQFSEPIIATLNALALNGAQATDGLLGGYLGVGSDTGENQAYKLADVLNNAPGTFYVLSWYSRSAKHAVGLFMGEREIYLFDPNRGLFRAWVIGDDLDPTDPSVRKVMLSRLLDANIGAQSASGDRNVYTHVGAVEVSGGG